MRFCKITAMLALLTGIAACGSSNNNNTTFVQPPAGGIEFPVFTTATNGDYATVHTLATGISSPLTEVAIFLNSVEDSSIAPANDFFRFGFSIVGISEESNQLLFRASDGTASSSVSVTLVHGSSWMSERGLQRDATGSRWLAVDAARRALLELDLDTGTKTVLSGFQDDGAALGSGVDLIVPEDMVVDTVNGYRALVVDSRLQAIVAIDLTTGARTTFSDGSVPTAANAFELPVAIAINAAGDTAYVLDAGQRAVFSVDLVTAATTLLSSNTAPAGGPDIEVPTDLALQESQSRLFVADAGTQAVIAVDLGSGSRSIFSDSDTPNDELAFFAIKQLVVDGDSLYVSDTGRNAVIEVDLRADDPMADPPIVNGSRTLFIDTLDDGESRDLVTANPLRSPTAMAIDSVNQHLLVVDNVLGNLVQIDTVDDAGTGTGTFKGQRNYVTGGATPEQALVTPTAVRAGNATVEFDRPSALTASATGTELYLIDGGTNALTAINPDEGLALVIFDLTSNTVLGINGELNFSNTGLLAALDQSLLTGAVEGSYTSITSTTSGAGTDAIFTITVDSLGAITDISVTTTGSGYDFGDTLTVDGADLGGTGSATLTLTNDAIAFKRPDVLFAELSDTGIPERFLVVDTLLDQVVEVSSTGDRTVVSDSGGLSLAGAVDGVLIDEMFYVLDDELDDIVVVDLSDGANGARSLLANPSAIVFNRPVAMVADTANEALYVVEESTQSLIEVTVADGTRATVPNYTAAVSALSGSEVIDMILDPGDDGTADDRLLVLDRGRGAIFPVELETGVVGTDLTSPVVPMPPAGSIAANPFISPRAMILNSRTQTLFVIDDEMQSLFIVDAQPRDETDDDVDNPVADGQRLVYLRGTALNQ